MVIRWKKHGLMGDLGAFHGAEIREGGLFVCMLRVTRHQVARQGRRRSVTKTEWRVAILEPGGDRGVLRARLDVPCGRWGTLAIAKAEAESELARLEARTNYTRRPS